MIQLNQITSDNIGTLFSGFAHAADPLRMQQQSTEMEGFVDMCTVIVTILRYFLRFWISFGYMFWYLFTKGVQSKGHGPNMCTKSEKGKFQAGGGRPSKCGQNVSKIDRE